ncbi:MAG TPA: SDR family oxidoreductase [Mucilaginibacter sp.]
MQKIVVTGGTGTLGRQVVNQLLARNLEVYVLSSRDNPAVPDKVKVIKGNLVTGEGLQNLSDANIIIHCASNPKDAQNTDIAGTGNLLIALDKAPMRHFINVCIVGVDKTDYPYYKVKTAVENLVSESGIPFTTLRATQFHDLVLNMICSFEINNGNILVPAGMKFQSIDVNEVAFRLAELTEERPSGLLPDMGGPEVLTIEEMIKTWVDISGQKLYVKAEAIESPRYDLFRSGVNLCPDHKYGSNTWEKFLAS